MNAFIINDDEWVALEGEPPKIFKIYCLIRRYMNYMTGLAGHLSESLLRAALEVKPVRGRQKKATVNYVSITQKEIRKILHRLVKLGLIDSLGGNLFRCKLATVGKCAQNMRGASGARRGAQLIKAKTPSKALSDKDFIETEKPDEGRDESLMRGVDQDIYNIKENNNNTDVLLLQKKSKTEKVLKKEKAVKFPDDFCINEKHIEIAKTISFVDPYEQFEIFKSYHISKGSLFVNWDMAFHTWLRKAKDYGRGNGHAAHKQTYKPRAVDWFTKINNEFIFGAERKTETSDFMFE